MYQITLISGRDSGQSDGLHSANLAEDAFFSIKDNMLARSLQKHKQFVRNHFPIAAIFETRNWRAIVLYFHWLKPTLPILHCDRYYVF